ncbi:hypothetical protein RCL1_007218 [Eukaryota sp. TZLM3-RCL]
MSRFQQCSHGDTEDDFSEGVEDTTSSLGEGSQMCEDDVPSTTDTPTASSLSTTSVPKTEAPIPAISFSTASPSEQEQEAALQKSEEEARKKFGNLTTNVAAFQQRKLRKRFDSADFFKQ